MKKYLRTFEQVLNTFIFFIEFITILIHSYFQLHI